jgi:hypothetical protein
LCTVSSVKHEILTTMFMLHDFLLLHTNVTLICYVSESVSDSHLHLIISNSCRQ